MENDEARFVTADKPPDFVERALEWSWSDPPVEGGVYILVTVIVLIRSTADSREEDLDVSTVQVVC